MIMGGPKPLILLFPLNVVFDLTQTVFCLILSTYSENLHGNTKSKNKIWSMSEQNTWHSVNTTLGDALHVKIAANSFSQQ